MARRRRITTTNVIVSISIIFFMFILFTWESRQKVSPIESSISYVVIPMQKGMTYFGDWLVERVNFVKNINELEELNANLSNQVDELTYEIKILEQSKSELDRLRELFDLDKRYADYPKTGARIIGKDPGNWYHVFTLDKGYKDGIEVDMVVLAGAGLVGKIIEVGPSYAKVRSIIDDTSSVSALIDRSEDLCVVKGDLTLFNQGLLAVEYLPDEVNLLVGDQVITSHLGNVYPPGILIGTIVRIDANENSLSQIAYLEPAVDFKHLQEVLVINQLWADEEN